MRSVLVVVAAVSCGVAVAVQAQVIGIMQRQIGALESTFITYFSGGVLVAVIALAFRGGNLAAASQLPWYTFGTGILGLFIIATVSLSVGEIGLVPALVLITVSQFVVGAVINHFGLLGAVVDRIDFWQVAGFALLGIGTYLVLR